LVLLSACTPGVATTGEAPSVPASLDSQARRRATVSFTFDDCYASQLEVAAPILAGHGFVATEYAAVLRMTEAPDIGNAPFMDWDGLHALHDRYGWDIASHTMTHPLLTTVNPDQLDDELVQSKQTLEQNGFTVTGFATPYGDYDDDVLRRAATVYPYHRPFHDTDVLNSFPVDRSLIWVKQVQVGNGSDVPGFMVDDVKGWIDEAISEQAWLVLVFHDVEARSAADLSSGNVAWGYAYNDKDFTAIVDYCTARGIAVRTVSQVLATPNGDNLVDNGGFAAGLAGFSTDAPDRVTVDRNDNGTIPTPTDSIALVGAATGAHLFAPRVAIDRKTSYTFEMYVNASALTAGTIGFYVDEWNVNGAWVSGQYIRDVPEDRRRRVEHVAFDYHPGPATVTASLQVILSPGSTGTAYVDEISLRAGAPIY
jgi:peptidoglycan/xylan/chitin deacetylase (PgdA/CDA1 family)